MSADPRDQEDLLGYWVGILEDTKVRQDPPTDLTVDSLFLGIVKIKQEPTRPNSVRNIKSFWLNLSRLKLGYMNKP